MKIENCYLKIDICLLVNEWWGRCPEGHTVTPSPTNKNQGATEEGLAHPGGDGLVRTSAPDRDDQWHYHASPGRYRAGLAETNVQQGKEGEEPWL